MKFACYDVDAAADDFDDFLMRMICDGIKCSEND